MQIEKESYLTVGRWWGVIDTRTCQLFWKATILESKFLAEANFPKYISEEHWSQMCFILTNAKAFE